MNFTLPKWLSDRLSFFNTWPRFCVECQSLCKHLDLCPSCQQNLPWLTHLPTQRTALIDDIQCLFAYQEPVVTWVHRLKFSESLLFAPLFAKLMANALAIHNQVEVISCVPMHPSKLKKRGFNQTQLIAEALAKQVGLPFELNLIEKVKSTNDQRSLSNAQRRKNLHKAFSVNPSILEQYQGVLIIDDVITTGSTIREVALSVRSQPNRQSIFIQVFSVCRLF